MNNLVVESASMYLPLCLLVISLLQSWVTAQIHRKAVVQVAEGRAHLLSGDSLRLTCHVPEDPWSPWTFQWFLNGRSVAVGKTYTFWHARILQSGNYTCAGARESELDRTGVLRTQISAPLWVEIDGGWIILVAPSKAMIMEETMDLTCRIRGGRSPTEVIFYLNGREIRRQRHNTLTVRNLTLDDEGEYSCRATWNQQGFYHSSESTGISVTILEILETPQLVAEIHPAGKRRNLKLTCRTQLNTRERSAIPVLHYFMKNDHLLGPATSQSVFTIQDVSEKDSGSYSCRASVPILAKQKWSYEVQVDIPRRR